jgi:hypothetical protein
LARDDPDHIWLKASRENLILARANWHASCPRTSGLQFSWTAVGFELPAAISQAAILRLPPNSFTPGNDITLKATVTTVVANAMRCGAAGKTLVPIADSISVSVSLSSPREAIDARIAGGDRRVSHTTSIVLDAGQTFDPELRPTPFAFLWTCLDDTQPCAGLAAPPATAVWTVEGLSPGEYVFAVSASKDLRQSTTSVKITVVADAVPAVFIETDSRLLKHNPENRLVVMGAATPAHDGEELSLIWNITECATPVDFPDVWDTISLPASANPDGSSFLSTSITSANAVVNPSKMVAGRSYKFVLSASNAGRGKFGSAEIVVMTNAVPQGGACRSVSPA